MSKIVERGKEISVVVEQAFPSCLLVSFQHEEKTFRGVLLNESTQTVMRASSSDILGKANDKASLGLTTARATTCQSSVHHTSTSRVSTRSSTVMLRDGNGESSGIITPVHKIRSIVESLNQRRRRQLPSTTQPNNPSSSTTGETQNQSGGQMQSLSPVKNNENISKAVKRKREETSSEDAESICKAARVRDKEVTDASNIVRQEKSKQLIPAVRSEPSLSRLSGHSPLFPILKLRRTAGKDNSYVAVTTFNSQSQLKGMKDTVKPENPAGESPVKSTGTIKNGTSHKHNTRFKARKDTENCETPLEPESKLDETNRSILNEGELVKVFTERSSSTVSESTTPQLKGNVSTNAKTSTTNIQNRFKSKRQFHPRKVRHNQDMRVGDIVWGKVHGHPWWPGRVMGILCHASENHEGCQVVKVSWYGSTTTSDISCSLLMAFQENFNHLFKKQKTGAYRRAVRQAQQDLDVCLNGHVMHV